MNFVVPYYLFKAYSVGEAKLGEGEGEREGEGDGEGRGERGDGEWGMGRGERGEGRRENDRRWIRRHLPSCLLASYIHRFPVHWNRTNDFPLLLPTPPQPFRNGNRIPSFVNEGEERRGEERRYRRDTAGDGKRSTAGSTPLIRWNLLSTLNSFTQYWLHARKLNLSKQEEGRDTRTDEQEKKRG